MKMALDYLPLVSKVLYNERILEQRKEIEELKQKVKDLTMRKQKVWFVGYRETTGDEMGYIEKTFEEASKRFDSLIEEYENTGTLCIFDMDRIVSGDYYVEFHNKIIKFGTKRNYNLS